MSRLVDRTICPDCRSALTADGRCTGCGLVLSGPLAVRLWETMVSAYGLVEELRSLGGPAATAATLPTASPAPDSRTPAGPPHRLTGVSVRNVLLALGALCLLVAAIVFVAVTWSVLGLTGRTLVLLAVTASLLVGAVAVTRRGLRGAAETLWLLVPAMLAVDLLGAVEADFPLVADLSWRGVAALVGGAWLVSGAGAALWARTQPVHRLYGAQVAAATGVLVVTVSNGWYASEPAVGTLVATVALVVLAWLVRGTLPPLAWFTGGLGLASWTLLLGHGIGRLADSADKWYAELSGWPLLACAVLAGALTVTRLSPVSRTAAAGLALAPLAVFVLGPESGALRDLLQACAVLLGLATLSALGPVIWGRAAAAWTGVGTLVIAGILVAQPAILLEDAVQGVPGPATRALHPPASAPEAWVWIVVATTVLLALAGLLRHLPAARRRPQAGNLLLLAPVVLVLGTATTLGGLTVPLWVVALGFLVLVVAATAALLALQDAPTGAVVAAGLVALGAFDALQTGLASELLMAAVASALTVLLALSATLLRPPSLWGVGAPLLAAAATLAGGLSVGSWAVHADASTGLTAWLVSGYAALVLLGSALLPHQSVRRLAVEGALLPVALAGAVLAQTAPDVAISLTVLGSAAALVGIVDQHRDAYRWLAAALLLAATMLRFEAGVSAPELVTLPAAAALVGAGAWQLLRRPTASSVAALTPGLALGLLPSLLIALDEPLTLRGVLVAVAGLLVLAVGVERRWATPLLAGALVTGLLTLRHLAPLADAVPRWASLGSVGLALLLVGVTWEARMRDIATASRYLRALR